MNKYLIRIGAPSLVPGWGFMGPRQVGPYELVSGFDKWPNRGKSDRVIRHLSGIGGVR